MAACFKCKAGRVFAASRDGPKKGLCAECLCQYLEKLVRDAFFRACAVPVDTPVAVCCSGGMASMMLLRIVARLRDENLLRGGEGRKVFDLRVVHLNELGLVRGPHPEAQFGDIERIVSSATAAAGLPLHVGRATELIPIAVVQEINGLSSLSAREELYRLARLRALATLSEAAGCRILMLADTAVRCAVNALSRVVRGGGRHIATEAGSRGIAATNHNATVLVLRPLRPVLSKEVALYCVAQSVPARHTPSPATGTSLRSIDRTLENFVHTLLVQFKSTAFNILNAVDKMHPEGDIDAEGTFPPPDASAPSLPAGVSCSCCGCGVEEPGPKMTDTTATTQSRWTARPLCYCCFSTLTSLRRAQPGKTEPQTEWLDTWLFAPSPVAEVRLVTPTELQSMVADSLLDPDG